MIFEWKRRMIKHVLLIDDDKEDQAIFGQELHDYDHRIVFYSALSGREAFDLLTTQPVDIIFLDINMPEMNGIDVLKELRNHESWQTIPVFMYSTSDGRPYKKMSLELGAANYFTKPTTIRGIQKIFDAAFSAVQL